MWGADTGLFTCIPPGGVTLNPRGDEVSRYSYRALCKTWLLCGSSGGSRFASSAFLDCLLDCDLN